jgi:RimJ/RimL family protein N-acetyltransferase
MPWLGLGVFESKDGDEVEQAVHWALDAGYRSIDTASIYGNEKGVGQALKEYGLPREQVFLTTKVWNSDQGYDNTIHAFKESLDRLQQDYVDLYLVHWPVKNKYKDTWRALEYLYNQGLVRAIGVSNFLVHHLKDLLSACQIKPMVNQVEFHPRLVQPTLLDFCTSEALLQVAQLVTDLPEIREVDVNPLLADPYGVIALDGRVRVARSEGPAHARLAVRPYPVELEEELKLPGGRTLLFRPIRPEDETMLKRAFERLTPEETRFRFMVPKKAFSHLAMARFTQIDYDRDMVMVLTERCPDGATEIHGVTQINVRPRDSTAEFAILIEERATGLGLGPFMLERIVDYARARGIEKIHGDVLASNTTMLKLCEVLGFTVSGSNHDRTVVRVIRKLAEP